MSLSEFDLIQRYFQRPSRHQQDVILGMGDDAAIVAVPADRQLVVAVDTLAEGIHFRQSDRPEDIGWKALAVNLSDLAAMGAVPGWWTLSLTLSRVDEVWLEGFAQGLFELADRHGLELIGGDTTRGPLAISIQAMGLVESGQALLRSAARPDDLIYVSGTLGDAAAALEHEQQAELARRLHRPVPRLELGRNLRDLAHACIDVSDGLLADLGHIAKASGLGAELDSRALPLSPGLRACCPLPQALALACSGGDDYELCFTLSPEDAPGLDEVASALGLPLTCIGRMVEGSGVVLDQGARPPWLSGTDGYRHF